MAMGFMQTPEFHTDTKHQTPNVHLGTKYMRIDYIVDSNFVMT
jgi:hypothetical protein